MLKKNLLYSVAAVILGLLVTLIPLLAFTEFTSESHYDTVSVTNSLPEQMRKLEVSGSSLNAPSYSIGDLEIFTISFVIAIVAYVLFKGGMLRRGYREIGLKQ